MPKKKHIPSPAERPDLYDAFDYPDRPEGYQNGCRLPDRLQKMLDEKKEKVGTAAE